jgi:hypothetical protein
VRLTFVILGAVNNLFEATFTKKVASMVIKLKFINEPKESEKWYTIRHGPAHHGCKELPSLTQGHLSNSLLISVELNHRNLIEDVTEFDICFEIIVRSGNKVIKMEGTYNFGELISITARTCFSSWQSHNVYRNDCR